MAANLLAPIAAEDIKVGAVFIGPKDDGFSGAHYNGIEGMKRALGLKDEQILYKFNVAENSECENALRELVEAGCSIIFGNSWGYMNYMEEIAEEYPDVIFSHCSGYKNNGVNFNNYFSASIRRAICRYHAGLKTETNLIGYVAAWRTTPGERRHQRLRAGRAERQSRGCGPYVKYINSWGDPTLEKQTAGALLSLNCDVIAQHVDSDMPQVAAQEQGKFGVGYNTDMTPSAPDAHLTAPIWHWSSVYTAQVKDRIEGNWKPVNYFLGLAENMVDISPFQRTWPKALQKPLGVPRQNSLRRVGCIHRPHLQQNAGELVVAEGVALEDSDITGNLMTTLLVKGDRSEIRSFPPGPNAASGSPIFSFSIWRRFYNHPIPH